MVLGFRKALEACDLWLLREEETTVYNREYFGSTWDGVFHHWREEQAEEQAQAAAAASAEGESPGASRADTPVVASDQSTIADGSMSSLEGLVVVANPRVGAEAGAGAEADTNASVPTKHLQHTSTDSHTSRVAPEIQEEQKSGSGRSAGQQAAKAANPSNKMSPAKVIPTKKKSERNSSTPEVVSKEGSTNALVKKASEKDGEQNEKEEEAKKEEEEKPQPPLLRTLIRVYGLLMLLAQLSMLVYVFVLFINPLLLW